MTVVQVLLSNIDDYAQFALMLMNKGELNGVRILSSASVELMSRNHLSDSILMVVLHLDWQVQDLV